MKLITVAFALSLGLTIFASASEFDMHTMVDHRDNGGDSCENRIQMIGLIIQSWINAGGAEALWASNAISFDQYKVSMVDAIEKLQVSCTDQSVTIGSGDSQVKTCKNNGSSGEIVCTLFQDLVK
ncbi:MAG: hypothetical protein R2827_08770 [Bdellovibrionales bacterium]